MNKDLWTYNKKGEIESDTDANDFYYHWVQVETEDGLNLEDLVEMFLGVGEFGGAKKVRIKAREGAIFIVKEGDKDDTENPLFNS